MFYVEQSPFFVIRREMSELSEIYACYFVGFYYIMIVCALFVLIDLLAVRFAFGFLCLLLSLVLLFHVEQFNYPLACRSDF